jgi:hypothetical protein
MCGAFARCASHCRISATTCSHSPACSIRNWPTSREPMRSARISCVKPARCTAYPAPQPRIGRAGTGFVRRWAASSTRCSTAVSRVMAQTPRSSSLVENLNSRRRTYFTLRRHLGNSYLDSLRFFFSHRRFMRSRCAERNAKKPPRSDDRPRPSALADAAGPRTTSASASLTRREVNRLLHPTDQTIQESKSAIRSSQAGGFRSPSVTPNWPILNHAGSHEFFHARLPGQYTLTNTCWPALTATAATNGNLQRQPGPGAGPCPYGAPVLPPHRCRQERGLPRDSAASAATRRG